MTINSLFRKLRRQNRGQYLMLGFCIFLSVLLVSSFSLMYYSPTVQDFLPQGGDTRKMASLLIAATSVGCLLFTRYASGLFFRYRSREYGVFLAMGTPRGHLKPVLFKELLLLLLAGAVPGFLISVPVSMGIWRIFSAFLISTAQMQYRFGFAGLVPGTLFTLALALLLLLSGLRFLKRSNLMDILKSANRTEMVRIIPPWTGRLGIAMIILGFFLATGVPTISAYVFHYMMPPVVNLTYLIALAGLYLFLLSTVAQANAKSKKEKYYKNLVNISMMRFSARAATRNMCVIAILLLCTIFSAFFGMAYSDTADIGSGPNSRDFAIHHPVDEKQVSREEIYALAREYSMEITDYGEETAANLIISYRHRDIDEHNQYATLSSARAKLALFFSETIYTTLTQREIEVAPGTYKTVIPTGYKASIFDMEDGLYEVSNPGNGFAASLSYAGSVEFDPVYYMSSPYAYVISDSDYQSLTESINSQYLERLVLFDVADERASYPFAEALLKSYIEHATLLSNHMGLYDYWEAELAAEKGEAYGYEGRIDLSPDNAMLLNDWKYKPSFTIVTQQNFLQLISVYVMLCLYICIITLATVAIMCYVRGVSAAADNRDLFESLEKLGADRAYRRRILRTQLLHLFLYPTATGCGLGLLFCIFVSFFNDGRFSALEFRTLLLLLGLELVIGEILYLVYRQARKQAEKTVGLSQ